MRISVQMFRRRKEPATEVAALGRFAPQNPPSRVGVQLLRSTREGGFCGAKRPKAATSVAGSFLLLLSLCLSGCTVPDEGAGADLKYQGSGPIQAVATIGMVADIVRNVGGNRVEVATLMGAGVDPHLYKARPRDISRLSNADIVFYSGLHLEGKMADVLERLGRFKPSIAVAESIAHATLLQADESTDFPDPHVWFDVRNWMKATESARDALVRFDPNSAVDYRRNAAKYLRELNELDDYARAQLATIPRERRVLVTAHDAFNYFGRAYDVEVMGLQGLSTASEVSLRDVQRIVDELSRRKIKAVFVESSVPKRSIEAVVQGCLARGHNVRIGGELFSDAMGTAGTPEGTYVGMVRHNVDTIVAALK